VLEEREIPGLPSARDFVAGRVAVEFPTARRKTSACRLVADPGNRVAEILEENNAQSLLAR
jgi:hypothetical protein